MAPLLKLMIILFLAVFCGCQTTTFGAKKFVVKPLNHSDRNNLLKHAQSALGKSRLTSGQKSFRADCSGTIRALFSQSRVPLGGVLKTKDDNDVKAIYRYVRKYGQIVKGSPIPGDLVFFHNTYDRNRSGRLDSPLTHIGIVEKVEGNTVYFIHHLGEAIIRSRMNLTSPKDAVDEKTGERINHVLRRAQGRFPAFTAAELFAGFGRL
jgi:hypothetical protein